MQIAQQRSTHTETLADYVLLIVNLVPGLVAESEVTWDERGRPGAREEGAARQCTVGASRQTDLDRRVSA